MNATTNTTDTERLDALDAKRYRELRRKVIIIGTPHLSYEKAIFDFVNLPYPTHVTPKELREIEADPADLSEWIDVAILALDGAWRAGFSPAEIIAAMLAKQAKNERRKWPDWRTMPTDKAIEHDRSEPTP